MSIIIHIYHICFCADCFTSDSSLLLRQSLSSSSWSGQSSLRQPVNFNVRSNVDSAERCFWSLRFSRHSRNRKIAIPFNFKKSLLFSSHFLIVYFQEKIVSYCQNAVNSKGFSLKKSWPIHFNGQTSLVCLSSSIDVSGIDLNKF